MEIWSYLIGNMYEILRNKENHVWIYNRSNYKLEKKERIVLQQVHSPDSYPSPIMTTLSYRLLTR